MPTASGVGIGDRALARHCRDDGNASGLGQRDQLGPGARQHHPAAREDDGPARTRERRDDALDIAGRGCRAGRGHRETIGLSVERCFVEPGRLGEPIGRDAQVGGTGPAADRAANRRPQYVRDAGRVGQIACPFRHRWEHRRLIDFLVFKPVARRRGGGPADGDERAVGPVRVDDRGGKIGRAGPVLHDTERGLAGEAGESIAHCQRRTLAAAQDHLYPLAVVGVDQRVLRRSREGEDVARAIGLHQPGERLSDVDLRHYSTLSDFYETGGATLGGRRRGVQGADLA